MRRRIFGIIMLFFILTGITAQAEQIYDINFRKHGGGQFIYCNNPEFVTAAQLSTDENPDAAYMMNNKSLKPGRYALFFCFVNYAGFDVEPDVEFKSESGADITINSIGYYVPQSVEFWDCIGAWSDLLGVDIRPVNGTEQYIHYSGERNIPAKIHLENSSDWASAYIYNYERLVPRTTFNMLIDFTIESGEADVNCAALKYYGILGDRSHHNPNAAHGKYINDTTVKGIDADTLPIVEADFDIDITGDMQNGKNLSVRVFNPFFPNGNIVPFWINNINPLSDASQICKSTAAVSDMLSLAYEDDSKLDYYGKNVPEEERSNIWYMDTRHCNTLEYDAAAMQNPDDYRPNEYIGDIFENSPLFEPSRQFNLGNFGVINRHNLRITNSDSVPRSISYIVKGSRISDIAILRDKQGNILNPYTHTRENPYAISKDISDETKEVCLFSALLQPGETREYMLDVVLPTNCFGGQQNILRADSKLLLENTPTTELPTYSVQNPYKNAFDTGAEYMMWQDKKLVRILSDGTIHEVALTPATRDLAAELDYELAFVKTDRGYAARYCAWDRFPDTQIAERGGRNKVYFFDDSFEYLYSIKFNYYIYDMTHSNHTLYVKSDGFYASEDNTYRKFEKIAAAALPVSNGSYQLSRPSWHLFHSSGGSAKRICFEDGTPPLMYASGDIFYYKKEYQEYVTDTDKKNVLAISPNGVTWYTRELSPQLLELVKVYDLADGVFVGSKYGVEQTEKLADDVPMIMHNGEYLAFNTAPEIKNGALAVPMDFMLERLGAEVRYLSAAVVQISKGDKAVIVRFGGRYATVDGVEERLGFAPYVKENQLMLPLRFVAKCMGAKVRWNEKTHTASVE